MHSRPQPSILRGSSLLLSLTARRRWPAAACGDTALTRGKSPPITQDWCRKFTQQTFLRGEMKEKPGSPAFLIGHTFLCSPNNSVIGGTEPRPHEVNTPPQKNVYLLNSPLRFHLVMVCDQGCIDKNAWLGKRLEREKRRKNIHRDHFNASESRWNVKRHLLKVLLTKQVTNKKN